MKDNKYVGLRETPYVLDRRSLAAGRLLLGLALFVDLLQRLRVFAAFYAPGGVTEGEPCAPFSAFCWSQSVGWSGFLFCVFALAIVAFTAGVRTKLAILVVLVLKGALNFRQPFLQNGGDFVAILLLFHALFLPVGERWSVDAWLARRRGEAQPPNQLRTAATFAVVAQLAAIYGFAAALKDPHAWLVDATAARDAMLLESYTKELGVALREFPALLAWGSRGVFLLEAAAPMLLLLLRPLRLRQALIGALILMHTAMGLTLSINMFSPVCIAGLVMIAPLREAAVTLTKIRFELFVRYCTVLVLVQNVFSLPPLRPYRTQVAFAGNVLGLWQGWGMFAPKPPREHGYVMITTTGVDGTTRDALTDRAPEVPDAFPQRKVMRVYPDEYWRRYLAMAVYPPRRPPPVALARFFCRSGPYGEAVEHTHVAVDTVRFTTQADGEVTGPVVRSVLRHDCARR